MRDEDDYDGEPIPAPVTISAALVAVVQDQIGAEHLPALEAACRIALEANAYFDLRIRALQPGERSESDRRTAVWKAVAKARGEGMI